MKSNWNYPTTVWVGENRINDLYDACKNLDIIKPLFVTDKDLVNLPFIKNIISENIKKFEKFNVYSNFNFTFMSAGITWWRRIRVISTGLQRSWQNVTNWTPG